MSQTLQYAYDREADVMYLSVGAPQPAKTVERHPHFIVRLHPETGALIGLTIINFSVHVPSVVDREGFADRGTVTPEEMLHYLAAVGPLNAAA
jgi:uncharacterized protein YuzE